MNGQTFSVEDFVDVQHDADGFSVVVCTIDGEATTLATHRSLDDARRMRDGIAAALATWDGWYDS